VPPGAPQPPSGALNSASNEPDALYPNGSAPPVGPWQAHNVALFARACAGSTASTAKTASTSDLRITRTYSPYDAVGTL
jgi:hypothetical protein